MMRSVLIGALIFLLAYVGKASQSDYHEGDLVLRGHDELLVQGKTLIVHGNITLYGDARLVLRDAHLSIDQTYHEEFTISLHDRAQLIIENSSFDATFDIALIQLWDRSSLLLNDSKVCHEIVLLDSASAEVAASSIRCFCAEENGYRFNNGWGHAKARFKDSDIHEIILGVSRYCVLSVSGLKPGKKVNFTLSSADVEAGDIPFELQLIDCSVEYCDFVVSKRAQIHFVDCDLFQLGCYDYAKVTVENSAVAQMVLKLERLWVSFGGLRTGYYEDWELRASSGWLPCSLRLINTSVSEGWYLRLRGGNYEIYNSDLVRFRNEFDTEGSRYLLDNCCILEWLPWCAHGEITLRSCVIGTIQAPDAATSTLRGEFCVLKPEVSSFFGPWRNNSKIRRYFPIQVFEPNGNPASGVVVEVMNPDGQLVQRTKTDSFGRAEISIVFDEENYSAMYTVRVPELGFTCSFGLCSSTPIRLPEDFSEPMCLDCTKRIPQMADLRGQSVGGHMGLGGLVSGESFLAWNSAMVVSSLSQRIADDPNRDILSISAAADAKFLYLRMDLRGDSPDISGQHSVYEFYLLSPEWDHCYKINASRGTIERMTCDWSQVLDTDKVECIAANGGIEVAVPLEMLGDASLIEIRAQTRIFPDKVVDFIQGLFKVSL